MDSFDESNPYAAPGESALTPAEKDLRQWGMFLHLSALIWLVTGGLGFAAPIVIWQIKKNDLPGLDIHGKNATNWIISSFIYGLLCIPLIFVFLIGIPLFIVLGVLTIVFPVVAGVKAGNGEVWKYPLSIEFIK